MNTKNLTFLLLVIGFICLLSFPIFADSDKEEELFFIAQKSFEDGFYDVSLGYFERFLKEFPETEKRPEAFLMIAQCFLKQAEYLNALEKLQQALEFPESERIKDSLLYWIAEVHFKGKNFSQAKKFCKIIIDDFPDSEFLEHAYYSLAWCYYEESNWSEAKKGFKKIIADYPESQLIEDSYFKIAECNYSLQKYQEAKDLFTEFINKFTDSKSIVNAYFYKAESSYYLENFSDALSDYLKVIELSPDSELAILSKTSLGWSHLKLKNLAEAQLYFDEAEELARSIGADMDTVILGKATLFSEYSKYEEAIASYEFLITNFSDSKWIIEAYLGKANVLYEIGKFDDAVDTYKEVSKKLSQGKEFEKYHEKIGFGLAWAYLKLDDLDQAMEVLENVATEAEDNLVKVGALSQIGDAYQEALHFEKALTVYDNILKNYPESFYGDYVQLQEALTLLKMERFENAILAFLAFQKNFPESKFYDESKYYLGLTYFNKGNFTSAKEHLKDFVESLSSESSIKPDSMLLLGSTLKNLEEYKKAINVFINIKKLYPSLSSTLQKCDYEIAMCYFGMGNDTEALKILKILVYKFPESQAGLDTLMFLGDYYSKAMNFETSIRHFQRIVEEFPYSDRVEEDQYRIAKLLLEQGDNEKAKIAMEEIVASRPEGEFTAFAILEIADLKLNNDKNYEEAIAAADSVVNDYPDFKRDGYIKKGKILRIMGKSKEALKIYEDAINAPKKSSTIKDVQIKFYIAETLEEAGRKEEAVDTYFKIAYLYPDNKSLMIRSYLRVARIFEDKEDWSEARKIYEKISQVDSEESKFALERLEWINNNVNN